MAGGGTHEGAIRESFALHKVELVLAQVHETVLPQDLGSVQRNSDIKPMIECDRHRYQLAVVGGPR